MITRERRRDGDFPSGGAQLDSRSRFSLSAPPSVIHGVISSSRGAVLSSRFSHGPSSPDPRVWRRGRQSPRLGLDRTLAVAGAASRCKEPSSVCSASCCVGCVDPARPRTASRASRRGARGSSASLAPSTPSASGMRVQEPRPLLERCRARATPRPRPVRCSLATCRTPLPPRRAGWSSTITTRAIVERGLRETSLATIVQLPCLQRLGGQRARCGIEHRRSRRRRPRLPRSRPAAPSRLSSHRGHAAG